MVVGQSAVDVNGRLNRSAVTAAIDYCLLRNVAGSCLIDQSINQGRIGEIDIVCDPVAPNKLL